MSNFEKQKHDQEPALEFTGALASFNGTEFAPYIQEALEESGLDPATYDPDNYGHENFRGFPVTEPMSPYADKFVPSPIIAKLWQMAEEGKVVIDYSAGNTHMTKPYNYPGFDPTPIPYPAPRMSNAEALSRLWDVSLEAIVDTETGATLAYGIGLSAEAGYNGHAIISTNDVQLKPTA